MATNSISNRLDETDEGQSPKIEYGLHCECCHQDTLRRFWQPSIVPAKAGKWYYDCDNPNCPMQSSLIWTEYVQAVADWNERQSG